MSKKPLDFKEMADRQFYDNPKVWEYDRKKSLGASETFACLRKAWFDKFGEDNNIESDSDFEERWGAMERGNVMEDHFIAPLIINQLPKYAKIRFAGQENQKTFKYYHSTATPDGLITKLKSNALVKYGIPDLKGSELGLEFKSIDPRANITQAKTVHMGQAQMQMGLFHAVTKWKPKFTLIFYINASFYDDMKIFPIEYEPSIFKAGVVRSEKLFAAKKASDLRAEGKDTNGCEWCKWKYACADASEEAFPDENTEDKIDQDTIDKFNPLVALHVKYKRRADENEKMKKEVAAEIKELLETLNHRRVGKDDKWSISYSWNAGRTTIDQKAMVEDGIDIDKYKKTGTGFDKLLVTEKEPSDG